MKRAALEHPKLYDLCSRLRVRRPTAVGILEMTWHFCARYTPQGDVGRYPDARIEAFLDWTGKPGKLVECLADTRWLDRHPKWRLLVHDWHDHADEVVRKRLARAGLPFLTISEKVTGHYPVTDRKMSATMPDNGSLPEPEPVPEPEPAPQLAAADVVGEIRGWFREYPNAGHLAGGPDDQLVRKCLGLAGGDPRVLRDALAVMGKAGKRPDRSWGWFLAVLPAVLGQQHAYTNGGPQ